MAKLRVSIFARQGVFMAVMALFRDECCTNSPRIGDAANVRLVRSLFRLHRFIVTSLELFSRWLRMSIREQMI